MKSEAKTFLTYVWAEATSPTLYVTAGIIGGTICFLTSHYSPAPFVVPLFVQVLARANVKFRHRHKDALVELPAQKKDPVFIMDMTGDIILSVGKTRELFNQYGISNIKEFISEEAFFKILASTTSPAHSEPFGVEIFSNCSLKWYEVRATATAMVYGDKSPKVLVWFQDISLRQVYYLRLQDLLRYSDTLTESMGRDNEPDCEARHLSIFMLKEYEGVFIARQRDGGGLEGTAYKVREHKIINSESICIPKDSPAPVNASQKKGKLLSADIADYGGKESFYKAFPFDPQVMAFLDVPVRNFIACPKGEIVIMAFNFRSRITVHERNFVKVVASIYKTMVMMADLKVGNALTRN